MSRLIDADVFEVVCFQGKSEEFLEGAKYILEMIDAQPTAYDVDAVVAELEDKIKDVEKIIVTPPQDKLDEIANNTAEDFIGAWKSAIKVVRKGGVE